VRIPILDGPDGYEWNAFVVFSALGSSGEIVSYDADGAVLHRQRF
jgi:hypothetical protein